MPTQHNHLASIALVQCSYAATRTHQVQLAALVQHQCESAGITAPAMQHATRLWCFVLCVYPAWLARCQLACTGWEQAHAC